MSFLKNVGKSLLVGCLATSGFVCYYMGGISSTSNHKKSFENFKQNFITTAPKKLDTTYIINGKDTTAIKVDTALNVSPEDVRKMELR